MDMEKTNDIVVTILTLAYNHEPYIRQCLDGIVMQQTNFKFELLIHDDASTDNTANIIREYAAKYPNIIKPIYQTENQYSQKVPIGCTYLYPRAQGKYIALCEGDDYWTDPLKLQKQVDFLESHPDYVMCSHRFKQYLQEEKLLKEDWYGQIDSNIHYTHTSYIEFREWYTQPLTVMFRLHAIDLSLYCKYKNSRDLTLFYVLLKKGKGVMLNESMAVYRIHNNGIWSGNSFETQRTSDIKACIGIYEAERTKESSVMLYNRISQCRKISLKYLLKNRILLYTAFTIIHKYYGFRRAMNIFLRSFISF